MLLHAFFAPHTLQRGLFPFFIGSFADSVVQRSPRMSGAKADAELRSKTDNLERMITEVMCSWSHICFSYDRILDMTQRWCWLWQQIANRWRSWVEATVAPMVLEVEGRSRSTSGERDSPFFVWILCFKLKTTKTQPRRRYTDSRHPTTELPDVRGGLEPLPSVRWILNFKLDFE